MTNQFETEKGELCTIELYRDEELMERYDDGDSDLIWIDRIHMEQYESIENFIRTKLADIDNTLVVNVNALRPSEVTVFSEGDDYYDLFPDGISVDELGDSCLGGDTYLWTGDNLFALSAA